MDLRLYGRVISRFRWLVVGGLLLAYPSGVLVDRFGRKAAWLEYEKATRV